MTPEWFVVLAAATAWVMGFLTCGSMIGHGHFWDGVRDVFALRIKRAWRRWKDGF